MKKRSVDTVASPLGTSVAKISLLLGSAKASIGLFFSIFYLIALIKVNSMIAILLLFKKIQFCLKVGKLSFEYKFTNY